MFPKDRESQVAKLGINANLSLDTMVKLHQLIWYTRELNGEEEADKVAKKFESIISEIIGTMDKEMENFVREYGEL